MIDDNQIDELADRISVKPEEFGRTFSFAQSDRDTIVDVATVAAQDSSLDPIVACLRYARDQGFLKRLVRKGIEAQIAGSILSGNGRVFAKFCETHLDVTPSVDVDAADEAVRAAEKAAKGAAGSAPDYEEEGLDASSFTADADAFAAQLQNTMRIVCQIADATNGVTGSGVLIAPHLVATAAHVLDPLRNAEGQGFKPNVHQSLRVSLDRVVAHETGKDGSIGVAEDWFVAESRDRVKTDANGVRKLPAAGELLDSHDVAIIRLGEAPGLIRGWSNLEEAGHSFPERRQGLFLHHHPGGAKQKVSHGARKGTHGGRFLHSCSTAGGSSGGPLMSPGARLVGIHHGETANDNQDKVGGGGDWLAQWWKDHPDQRQPDPALNPLWEYRSAGKVGTGMPVIGFDGLQRLIWEAQLGDRPLAAVVSMSTQAGLLLTDVIPTMLPGGSATVWRLRKAELDKIVQLTTDSQNPVPAVLEQLAAFLNLPEVIIPDLAPGNLSTDAIRASAMAASLADSINQVHGGGPIWLFVHVEDKPLLSAVSEGLGFLYRALLAARGNRGRLVVVGSDPTLAAVLREILRESFGGPIEEWSPEPPGIANVARYLMRWMQAVLPPQASNITDVALVTRLVMTIANEREVKEPDPYARLCGALRTASGYITGQTS